MLTVAQLAPLKDRDPYLYETLVKIVASVNATSQRAGVDPSTPSPVEARAVPRRFLPVAAASSPTACLAAPTASASTPARASSAKHCCKDETRTSKIEIRQATELRFSSFVFRASFFASFSTEE